MKVKWKDGWAESEGYKTMRWLSGADGRGPFVEMCKAKVHFFLMQEGPRTVPSQ